MPGLTRRKFVATATAAIGSLSVAGANASSNVAQTEQAWRGADLRLWYEVPATRWVDALPVGNGRLGGMVYGGAESHPTHELIALNEDTLWSGRPRGAVQRIRRQVRVCAGLVLLGAAPPMFAQVSVLTQHNDNARTGANLHETVLTPRNVNKQQFGMIFKREVDDQLYTQPLIVTGVRVAGGLHDLVIVTTVNNSVYAFDANDTAAVKPFWHVNFGTPADLHDANFGCLDINGKIGIIGTPVVDAEKKTVYVVALTRVAGGFNQRLHALDVVTGADLAMSPVTIAAPAFDPLMQNQRPALALANGKVYVGYASHCDKQPYHGFLFAFDASSLQQRAVFNTSPGGEGASIWQSGEAPAIDEAGDIFVVTGNGTWDGTANWSESFLRLDPDLKLLDWFTPTNHEHLDKVDNDLDSSGATLIPGTQLVLGGGKEGVLYALDAQHLGHLGDEHALEHFQATASHLHSLVYWSSATHGGMLYVWGQRDRAKVYAVKDGAVAATPSMSRPEMNEGHPGAMLSLSANGDRDGILWAAIHATGDSWHESRPGVLHAYEGDNISHELWNSLQIPSRDDCRNYSKMAPPTIANGKVYLASFGTDNIGTGQLCVYGLLPSGKAPAAPANVRATVLQQKITVDWDAVPGADTYAVEATYGGVTTVVASGLMQPGFVEAAANKGSTEFRVIAVGRGGRSDRSQAATVMIGKAPVARMQH